MSINVKKSSYTLRCEAMIEKFGKSVPVGDIWSLGLICGNNIERLEQLSPVEKMKFYRGKERRRFGYTHKLLKLVGDIDLQKAFYCYEELMREIPLIRTHYIFDNVSAPLVAVDAPSPVPIPVQDISQLAEEQQSAAIQNTLAAELHREYDPQRDSILRLRGFLTGTQSISVIVSICAATGFSMTAEEIAEKIFCGMSVISDSAPSEPVKDQRSIAETTNRLKEMFSNIPLGQSLPGYIANTDQSSEFCNVYMALDWELNEKIRDFCYDRKLGRREFFLTAWSELQGRFNSANEVTMVLHGAGTNLFPIKANRSLKVTDCAGDIAKQAACMVSAEFSELCESAGIEKENFLTEHRFIDFTSGNTASDNSSSPAGVLLSVSYILQRNKSGIIYSYRAGSFYNSAIERIHKLFINIVEELMSPEQKRVDLWKILKISDKDETQLRKAQIMRKAVILSESGLFPDCSTEELTRLAENTRIQEYTVDAEIFSERCAAGELAIIADGKVEECKTGAGGIVKSISMLKKGDIFCLKALLDDNISAFTYIAASDNAEVLWIKRQDFISFASISPKIWLALIEKVSDKSDKMKRLWTIM